MVIITPGIIGNFPHICRIGGCAGEIIQCQRYDGFGFGKIIVDVSSLTTTFFHPVHGGMIAVVQPGGELFFGKWIRVCRGDPNFGKAQIMRGFSNELV